MSQPRIAVVGGGIAGTLCSLVLKNRGAHPTIIDAGGRGMGGRLRGGAQFLRAADPRLAMVCSMLEREGLLARWQGRFGVLGSSGGGFLPAEIVTSTGVGGMRKSQGDDDEADKQPGAGFSTASDGDDFCRFVDGSTVPTYVGVPSMADLCPEICRLADINEVGGTRVVGATPSPNGGWKLDVHGGDSTVGKEKFDALVLATHDPSLASCAVHSIVEGELVAGGYTDIVAATADDSSVISRLLRLADALQHARDKGRMPVYTLSATYPKGFSDDIPFDAVSVPGSHLLQFLTRDASKPGVQDDNNVEEWTAVSTSRFAEEVLSRPNLSDENKISYVSTILPEEVARLVARYYGGNVAAVPRPLDISVKRWGAAFCSNSLDLQEDSIALAPWRLAICGDFVRDMSAHATPLEAAALSGLEAGERIASFFQQELPPAQ